MSQKEPEIDIKAAIDAAVLRLAHPSFWRAPPPPGVWRIAMIFSPEPRSFFGGSEQAAVLEIPHGSAQSLACEMLGIPGQELPALIDSSACLRSIALALLSSPSGAFSSVSFAEAGEASAPRSNDPRESRSHLSMTFEQASFEGSSLGLAQAALAFGGAFRHSDPAMQSMALECASNLPPLAFDPRSGAIDGADTRFDDLLAWPPQGLGGRAQLSIDSRSAARALGLGFQASAARPASIGHTFIHAPTLASQLGDLDAAQSSALAQALSFSGPRAEALAKAAALHEAEMLAHSIGPSSAPAHKRRPL